MYLFFLTQLFLSSAYADLLVIGHPDVSVTAIQPSELADVFLKRHATLDNGSNIIPVNRSANSSVRTHFENEVLGLSEREIKNYWLKLRFKGIRPPIVQDSDEASILFVKRVAGAISYIEGEHVPSGTKLLLRIER